MNSVHNRSWRAARQPWQLLFTAALLGTALLSPSTAAGADETSMTAPAPRLALEEIRVLALDPPRRAVIRLAGGPLRTVTPGEEIEPARARVVSVGVDTITVETVTDDAEPTRLRAWIYRVESSDEVPRVLRLDPRRPVEPLTSRPHFVLPEDAASDDAGSRDAIPDAALPDAAIPDAAIPEADPSNQDTPREPS